MRHSLFASRFSALLLGFAVALAPALVVAPCPAAGAQQPAQVAGSPAANPQAAEAPQSEEQQVNGYLHGPVVRSIARMLHLDVGTTSLLFVAINFAIIFLVIAIPLFRIVPNLLRKRSQTLRQDIATARQATEDANTRLKAVEAKLVGLGHEIEQFRVQVEQDSLQDEKRIKAALEEESQRIVASAEQEIGAAAAQARRGLRNFAAELAIEQAGKQLVLSPETDRAVIAEFVSQASGDGRGGKN